jgi:gas vesicle protein
MNKIVIGILGVGILVVGAIVLMPEKEPTVQDKLKEAKESLSEAAELAKEAAEEQAEEIGAELEETLANAKQSTLDVVADLQNSATETALNLAKLQDDIKTEFDEGGALNIEGYDPSKAAAALEDIGLNKEAATSLSEWLTELYETPEKADEAISDFLDKLK